VWSKVGHFSKPLAKGPYSTTWIWNLHAEAHDFDKHDICSSAVRERKIFSSNLAHLSLVFFWIGGMTFHAAYFSNYSSWLKDPKHCVPTAQYTWSIVGQDILNSDVGGYFQGLYITSGIFQLWRSQGIFTVVHLKYACLASLIFTLISIIGSYIHMHISWSTISWFTKLRALSLHHLSALFGLGSISYSGHIIHISLPLNSLLDCGVDPSLSPQDLLSFNLYESIFPGFGSGPINISLYLPTGVDVSIFFMNPSTGSIMLGQIAAHHIAIGLVLIVGGLVGFALQSSSPLAKISLGVASLSHSWHAQLSINMAITGSASIVFAHHIYSMPVYPFCASDYPTVVCLFSHHIWMGGIFCLGSGAHASIFMIRDYLSKDRYSLPVELVICHRDIVIGHLIWVCIALGFHSFALYIHNDTLQALGRPEDMFCDNSIQLKPVFAIWLESIVGFDIEVLDGKVLRMTQELGTADFIVHHIHAFTIHTTSLILLKGTLYARSSMLVPDKALLGFRYPCDGPGRGGTCQISPWDHIYLATFWMYNTHSVVLFHYFWKMQSDVWGTYEESSQSIVHLSGGDFSSNAGTVNGWLRNLLWAQSAQVISSYGTSISGYGLLFISSHFVWAFSLMFLFSGRGYWQELIESIVWSHVKLKLVANVQPRALSISQGRAVGVTHFVLGGIGCSWAYFIARMIVLSLSKS